MAVQLFDKTVVAQLLPSPTVQDGEESFLGMSTISGNVSLSIQGLTTTQSPFLDKFRVSRPLAECRPGW
jgi:hypothetical protein